MASSSGSSSRVIKVKTLDQQSHSIEIVAETTVAEVKAKLSQLLADAPVDRQRLIFKGRALRDDQTAEQIGLESDVTIHMVLRPTDAEVPSQSDGQSQEQDQTSRDRQSMFGPRLFTPERILGDVFSSSLFGDFPGSVPPPSLPFHGPFPGSIPIASVTQVPHAPAPGARHLLSAVFANINQALRSHRSPSNSNASGSSSATPLTNTSAAALAAATALPETQSPPEGQAPAPAPGPGSAPAPPSIPRRVPRMFADFRSARYLTVLVAIVSLLDEAYAAEPAAEPAADPAAGPGASPGAGVAGRLPEPLRALYEEAVAFLHDGTSQSPRAGEIAAGTPIASADFHRFQPLALLASEQLLRRAADLARGPLVSSLEAAAGRLGQEALAPSSTGGAPEQPSDPAGSLSAELSRLSVLLRHSSDVLCDLSLVSSAVSQTTRGNFWALASLAPVGAPVFRMAGCLCEGEFGMHEAAGGVPPESMALPEFLRGFGGSPATPAAGGEPPAHHHPGAPRGAGGGGAAPSPMRFDRPGDIPVGAHHSFTVNLNGSSPMEDLGPMIQNVLQNVLSSVGMPPDGAGVAMGNIRVVPTPHGLMQMNFQTSSAATAQTAGQPAVAPEAPAAAAHPPTSPLPPDAQHSHGGSGTQPTAGARSSFSFTFPPSAGSPSSTGATARTAATPVVATPSVASEKKSEPAISSASAGGAAPPQESDSSSSVPLDKVKAAPAETKVHDSAAPAAPVVPETKSRAGSSEAADAAVASPPLPYPSSTETGEASAAGSDVKPLTTAAPASKGGLGLGLGLGGKGGLKPAPKKKATAAIATAVAAPPRSSSSAPGGEPAAAEKKTQESASTSSTTEPQGKPKAPGAGSADALQAMARRMLMSNLAGAGQSRPESGSGSGSAVGAAQRGAGGLGGMDLGQLMQMAGQFTNHPAAKPLMESAMSSLFGGGGGLSGSGSGSGAVGGGLGGLLSGLLGGLQPRDPNRAAGSDASRLRAGGSRSGDVGGRVDELAVLEDALGEEEGRRWRALLEDDVEALQGEIRGHTGPEDLSSNYARGGLRQSGGGAGMGGLLKGL